MHRIRVNAAYRLFEHDLITIQDVCWPVGYENLGFFRRLFKRYTGTPPRQYRDHFGINPPESVALAGRTPHR